MNSVNQAPFGAEYLEPLSEAPNGLGGTIVSSTYTTYYGCNEIDSGTDGPSYD